MTCFFSKINFLLKVQFAKLFGRTRDSLENQLAAMGTLSILIFMNLYSLKWIAEGLLGTRSEFLRNIAHNKVILVALFFCGISVFWSFIRKCEVECETWYVALSERRRKFTPLILIVWVVLSFLLFNFALDFWDTKILLGNQ